MLEPGVHALRPGMFDPRLHAVDEPLAHVYVDSRGVWIQLRDGVRGTYVNGRPVRRMAMLRAGDSIFIEGTECLLVGRRPEALPDDAAPRSDTRAVLRAVAGRHHGRCFALDHDCVLGRAPDCDVPLDDENLAAREVTLRATSRGVRARVASQAGLVTVNGHPIHDALLLAGDQLVVAGQHRFVVEASRPLGPSPVAAPRRAADRPVPPQVRRAARRLPWLLLAAALLAGALSLLLLYGAA